MQMKESKNYQEKVCPQQHSHFQNAQFYGNESTQNGKQYNLIREEVEERIRHLQSIVQQGQDPGLRAPQQCQEPVCKYCLMEQQYMQRFPNTNVNVNQRPVHQNNAFSTHIQDRYLGVNHYNVNNVPQIESSYTVDSNNGQDNGLTSLVQKLPLQSNRSQHTSPYHSSNALNLKNQNQTVNQALLESVRIQKQMCSSLKAMSQKLQGLSNRSQQSTTNPQDPYMYHYGMVSHSHPNLHGNVGINQNQYGNNAVQQYYTAKGYPHSNFNNGYGNANYHNAKYTPSYQYNRYGEQYPQKYEQIGEYERNGRGFQEGRFQRKKSRSRRRVDTHKKQDRSRDSSKFSNSAQSRAKSVSGYSSVAESSNKKLSESRPSKEQSSPKRDHFERFSRTKQTSRSNHSKSSNTGRSRYNSSGEEIISPPMAQVKQSEYYISKPRYQRTPHQVSQRSALRSEKGPKIINNRYCPIHYTNEINEIINLYNRKQRNGQIYKDSAHRNKKHESQHLFHAFQLQQKARRELVQKIGKCFGTVYGVK